LIFVQQGGEVVVHKVVGDGQRGFDAQFDFPPGRQGERGRETGDYLVRGVDTMSIPGLDVKPKCQS
jgi:hypothetical protein